MARRHSSVGQSARFTSVRSQVRAPLSPPIPGALAQLVAHNTGSVGVRGSTPLCSTKTQKSGTMYRSFVFLPVLRGHRQFDLQTAVLLRRADIEQIKPTKCQRWFCVFDSRSEQVNSNYFLATDLFRFVLFLIYIKALPADKKLQIIAIFLNLFI